MTYSFTGPQDYAKIGADVPESVKIINPLGTILAYAHHACAAHALGRSTEPEPEERKRAALFEVSRGYFPQEGEPLPHEVPMIVLAQTGSKDFFDMKGILENIVRLTAGAEIRCGRADEPWLHLASRPIFLWGQKNRRDGQRASGYHEGVRHAGTRGDCAGRSGKLYALAKPETKFKALPKFRRQRATLPSSWIRIPARATLWRR